LVPPGRAGAALPRRGARRDDGYLGGVSVSTPETVRAGLESVAAENEVGGLMVVTTAYDCGGRRRADELLADALALAD
jgi:hypothetical protein